MRAGREWQRIRLLPGRVRVQVSSPAPKIAPLAQMVERRSYKPEVGGSKPPRGTKFGGVVTTGTRLACTQQMRVRLPSPPPVLSGHNSVAECLVANENAAGSIPADRSRRCWYMGCARAFQAREAGSSPARRSKFSGCRVTGSSPALGAGRWRFKSSHPDQNPGSGLVLKAPVSDTGDRWLKSSLPDQILRSRLEPGPSMVS